jgi:hypothetical protein
LRAALLSAQGAEFALGPLESLGELFAEARLIFRQRRPSDKSQASIATVESGIPSALPETIHRSTGDSTMERHLSTGVSV